MVLSAGGAHAAADCTNNVLATQTNAVAFAWQNWILDLLGGNDTLTCNVVAPLAIPNGAIGYYVVDNRGFSTGENGANVDVTTDPDFAAAQSQNFTGDSIDYTHTTMFASGPRADFNADITATLNGVANDPAVATLDSTDIAVFYTTMGELQASIDSLNAGRTSVVTHLSASAGLLTGSDKPIDVEGTEVTGFGALGSYMFGAAGHFTVAEGFSVLGGVSLINQGSSTASAQGPLAAVAVRYVDPANTSGFRLFGEGGVNVAALSTSFTRTYLANISAQPLSVTSTTSATYAAVYFKGGVLIDIDDVNEVALSATVQGTGLGVAGYAESLTTANPFPATVAAQTGYFTTVKGNAAWTTELMTNLDLTATVGVGATMSHTPVNANIAFVGAVAGAPANNFFAEYGVRLGWSPTDTATFDTFVQGSTATVGGTHVQGGVGARLKF
jgi:hypothetical protein